MKFPARKSTLCLSLFLIAHGGLIAIRPFEMPTLQAITALLAVAAGVFLWMDR